MFVVGVFWFFLGGFLCFLFLFVCFSRVSAKKNLGLFFAVSQARPGISSLNMFRFVGCTHGRKKNRRRLVFDQVLPERNTQPSHRACLKTGDLGTSRPGHSTAHGTALLKSAAACVCLECRRVSRAPRAPRVSLAVVSRVARASPRVTPSALLVAGVASSRGGLSSRRALPLVAAPSPPLSGASFRRASDELQTSFRRASDSPEKEGGRGG